MFLKACAEDSFTIGSTAGFNRQQQFEGFVDQAVQRQHPASAQTLV